MAEQVHQLLINAARYYLQSGKKKGFSPSAALSLAGEILAVAAGLKPAFLYDYNAAGVTQIRSYVQQLQTISQCGCRFHVLSIGDNVLILNVDTMLMWLKMLLLQNTHVYLIDISASRECCGLCEPKDVSLIKSHISEILNHIKALAADSCQMLSSSAIFSSEWNLCTVFGVLLGYPASYNFPAQKNSDNCLTLAPLRMFTVRATCCKLREDLRVRFYSFSVPENLYPVLRSGLDAWCEKLKDAFKAQQDFTHLSITAEIVTLKAVAL